MHLGWKPVFGNDVIRLPRGVGFLFGNARQDQRFLVRGLLFQLLAYEIVAVDALTVLGRMSLATAMTILTWSFAAFSAFLLGVYWLGTRRL